MNYIIINASIAVMKLIIYQRAKCYKKINLNAKNERNGGTTAAIKKRIRR